MSLASPSDPASPPDGPITGLVARSSQARRIFSRLHRLTLQPDQPTAILARQAYRMTPQALDRRLNAGEGSRQRIRADVPGRRGRGGTALRSISTALAEAPVVLARPGLYGPALRRRIADALKAPAERRRLHLAVLDALAQPAGPLPLWLSVQTPRSRRRPLPGRTRIRTGRGAAPLPGTGSVGHVVNLTALLTPLYQQLVRSSPPARRSELTSLIEALLADVSPPAPPSPRGAS